MQTFPLDVAETICGGPLPPVATAVVGDNGMVLQIRAPGQHDLATMRRLAALAIAFATTELQVINLDDMRRHLLEDDDAEEQRPESD